MSPRQPKDQPGRRVPSKSHGLRGPGPAGRPPRDADLPSPTPLSAATPAGSAAPGASPAGDAAAFGTPTTRPGTRAANRAAKRAATGVRPKTQVRARPKSTPARGSTTGLILLGVIAVVVVGAVVAIGNPFGSASPSSSPATPVPTRLLTGCPTAAPAGLPAGQKRTVTLATSQGDIVIEVDANLAPVAAANFVALAECGFYDGVIFHRVIPDFMIQGGDGQFAWSGGLVAGRAGQGGPGYEFADETVNGEYTRGTVAMANSGPDTNGSQFFIMVKDSTTLSKDYVIFGHVTAGMEVADKIVTAPRDADDYPDNPVAITSATVAPLPSATPGATPTAAPSAAPPSGTPAGS